MTNLSFDYPIVLASPSESQVPVRPGIYAFFLNVFRPEAFGVYKTLEPSREQLRNIKGKFQKRAEALHDLLWSLEAMGSAGEKGVAPHIQRMFEVSISRSHRGTPEWPNEIGEKEVVQYLGLMSEAWPFFSPIYVGMTEKQSLRERYSQHRDSFNSKDEGKTSFGSRLRASPFGWEDVVYVAVPISSGTPDQKILRNAEFILQMLSKPLMSRK